MRERDIHPCFSCTLPDCDEASRACGLRQVINLGRRKYRGGERLTEDERQRFNAARRELYTGASDLQAQGGQS